MVKVLKKFAIFGLILAVGFFLHGKIKSSGNIYSIRETNVDVADEEYVIPLGIPIGMYLHTEGVMIIGTESIIDELGHQYCPAKDLVSPGEYISSFNGINVSSKSHLLYLIKKNGNKPVKLTIKKEKNEKDIVIDPIKDENGDYKLGIWVRDDTQGLGTITYVTSDNRFAALGHGVTDIDTGKLIESNDGKIYEARIWSIKKGEEGAPGSLCGSIEYEDDKILGLITKNSEEGIFGTLLEDKDIIEIHNDKVKIGSKKEIKEGPAQILFTVEGKTEEFDIEISKINYLNNKENKNLVLKITDEKLINETGGIVQGMSGSPIIQNGKLVGAVTHVLVDDPTRGYGIFLENMLKHGN